MSERLEIETTVYVELSITVKAWRYPAEPDVGKPYPFVEIVSITRVDGAELPESVLDQIDEEALKDEFND